MSVAADARAVSVPPFLLREMSPMTAALYSAPVLSRIGPMMSVAAVFSFDGKVGLYAAAMHALLSAAPGPDDSPSSGGPEGGGGGGEAGEAGGDAGPAGSKRAFVPNRFRTKL